MDIAGWLRGIGLAQYAEAFRANDIDGDLLSRLTNDDLKDIGVASLGHRKKLLEAVAARVQALAEPGAVLVTTRVQRQVAGLFVAEERGNHTLKGVPDLVTLFRMVRASGGGRRAGQRHLTPLVGRDEEIAMLMRRLHPSGNEGSCHRVVG